MCLLVGAFSLCHCHISPSSGLDRGAENWCFLAFLMQILASNLDWKLIRGPATKICWSFVNCAICGLVDFHYNFFFFFHCLLQESIPVLLHWSPACYPIANRTSSLGKPSKHEVIVPSGHLPGHIHPSLMKPVRQQSNGATPGFQVLKACDWSLSILFTVPAVILEKTSFFRWAIIGDFGSFSGSKGENEDSDSL